MSVSHDDNDMDVDDATHITSRSGTSIGSRHNPIVISTNTSTVDLNEDIMDIDDVDVQGFTTPRTFRLVFVPDPTRAVTLERARKDLAYVKTSITGREWQAIKLLKGSVHFLKWTGDIKDNDRTCTVLMQEWVIIHFVIFVLCFEIDNIQIALCYDSIATHSSCFWLFTIRNCFRFLGRFLGSSNEPRRQ